MKKNKHKSSGPHILTHSLTFVDYSDGEYGESSCEIVGSTYEEFLKEVTIKLEEQSDKISQQYNILRHIQDKHRDLAKILKKALE